jgi:hypothetical protein
MRSLVPSYLHHQSSSEWATYELEEKNHFVTFNALLLRIFGENGMHLRLLSVCSAFF